MVLLIDSFASTTIRLTDLIFFCLYIIPTSFEEHILFPSKHVLLVGNQVPLGPKAIRWTDEPNPTRLRVSHSLGHNDWSKMIGNPALSNNCLPLGMRSTHRDKQNQELWRVRDSDKKKYEGWFHLTQIHLLTFQRYGSNNSLWCISFFELELAIQPQDY